MSQPLPVPQTAEERIAQLERQLQESQSVAQIGSWELDLITGCLVWSDQIYVMFGLTPGEFAATYDAFLERVHPDDRDAVNQAYKASVEKRTDYCIVHRLLLPDGSVKYVEERGRTVYDPSGRPLRSTGTVQDISDLRRSETALRAANARLREEVDDQAALLRHIADSSPDEIIVIDDSGRILFANRIPAGMKREEIFGTSFFRQIPQNHLAAFKDCVVRALANGQSNEIELNYNAGPFRRGDFLVRVTRIPQGAHRLLILITDITSRKNAEEGARRQDSLRRAVEKLAMVASWEWSPEGGYLISPDLPGLLHSQAPLEDIDQMLNFLSPEDRKTLKNSLANLHTQGLPFDREVEVPDRGSRRMFLRITGARQDDRLFGYVQDITDRKSSELMILSWFAELRALQRALEESAIVSVTSLDGVIMDVNDHFCASCGYARDELVDQPHSILNSGFHSPQFWAEMWQTIHAGRTWRAEVCNRAKDGSLFWVDTVINPIHDEHGQIVKFLSIRNLITDRKKTEDALIHAREEAERASVEKSNFLARMSHEIRTPMNGIIGLASILLGARLSEEDLERVRGIHQSANNLLRIVNDILDYSKIEAGRIELVPSPFSPHDVISETIQILPRRDGVEIHSAIDEDVPLYVEHDPVRLRQVLLNLAGNAVKFTESGLITIGCRLVRGTEDTVLEFFVEDTGIGILPGDLARLFEPYVQGDLSRQRRFEGTGLGLAISRELVHIMGGELHAESVPGQGARFWFTLPCKRASSPMIREIPAAAPDRNLAVCFPMRILVVDDNHLNRVVAVAYLSAFGYTAVSVESGAEAVEIARNTPFDLIFMDVHMPEMDGLEAARRIRRQNAWPQMPVIVALTADALAGDSGGMDGWLLKPMSLPELEKVLRAFGSQIAGGEPLETVSRH
jgi:PAS domain S-box-containing protein